MPCPKCFKPFPGEPINTSVIEYCHCQSNTKIDTIPNSNQTMPTSKQNWEDEIKKQYGVKISEAVYKIVWYLENHDMIIPTEEGIWEIARTLSQQKEEWKKEILIIQSEKINILNDLIDILEKNSTKENISNGVYLIKGQIKDILTNLNQ